MFEANSSINPSPVAIWIYRVPKGALLNLSLELITLIVVNSTAARGTSQNHRIAVLEGTSGGHLGQTSAQVGSHRVSCPGLCADGF